MLRDTLNIFLIVFLVTGCDRASAPLEQPKTDGPHVEQANSQPEVMRGTQHESLPMPGSQVAATRFRDVTQTSGVNFNYSSGRSAGEFAIIESLGGGVGLFDFDRDGRMDLMFAGGGTLTGKKVRPLPCGLFRNLGDLRFQESTNAGFAGADQFFTHGVSAADFDADGFQDLSISGYGGVQLLRNQGDGTFVALAPLITNEAEAWSSSLAWADLDNNGFIDLYVTHYVDWSWSKHPTCRGQGDVEREVCAPREFDG
ncbi:MAG: VCBS repeat-containing protein, partial [Aureliella sp.]